MTKVSEPEILAGPSSAVLSELEQLMPFFRDAGVMEFPQMILVSQDGEPAVLKGRGVLEMPRPDKMIVRLEGRPEDLRHSLHAINRLHDHPYENLYRLRIHMTDTVGRKWSANCAFERVEPGEGECIARQSG